MVTGRQNIAKETCEHFQKIFIGEDKIINEGTLDCNPRMMNQEQNDTLIDTPIMEELKVVIFSMDPTLLHDHMVLMFSVSEVLEHYQA